jgi:hypothetical protein
MGGRGSSRWHGHLKKDTVEDCLFPLNVNRMVQEGVIRMGAHSSASWVWIDVKTGEEKSRIGYRVDCRDPFSCWLWLYYTIIRTLTGEEKNVDYKIGLQTTVPHFGGIRWWFSCPICGRRAAKLYVPPGASIFACRQCHRLTYDSCLLSNNRDIVQLAREFGRKPGEVRRILLRREV